MGIIDQYEIEVVDVTCLGLGKGVPDWTYFAETSRLGKTEAAEQALKHYANLYGYTFPVRIYAFSQPSVTGMMILIPMPLGLKMDAESNRAMLPKIKGELRSRYGDLVSAKAPDRVRSKIHCVHLGEDYGCACDRHTSDTWGLA
jgi:hypothetical protein